MWIAKNDITGKEYGVPYKSIYDCQRFIDTKLINLQFLYSMIVGIENEIENEKEYTNWLKENNKDKNGAMAMEIFNRIEYAVNKMINNPPRNPRNNVIRCYETNQKRYATGFDF